MLVELFKTNLYLSYMAVVAIVIIVLVKLLFGKRFSARWNYAIWFLLIARLVIPFSIPFQYSVFNLMPQNTHVSQLIDNSGAVMANDNSGKATKVPVVHKPANGILEPAYNEAESGGYSTKPSAAPAYPPKTLNAWEIAAYVWLAGFISFFIFFISCYFVFSRRIYRQSLKNTGYLDSLTSACTVKAGLGHRPGVLAVEGFSSPFVFSMFKPIVVLPAQMVEELPDSSREHVLLHEFMHIKYRDHRINQLILLFTALHWFNPFIWLAFKAMKKDCELACDASVLKCISNREHRDYANTLLEIAQLQNTFNLRYSVLSFGESNIKRRVKHIMKFKKSSIGIAIIAFIVIAAVSVVIMTGGNLKSIIKLPASDKPAQETVKNDTPAQEDSKKPDIYESSKLGLSITFPEAWKGKYRVIEGYSDLTVCFKPETEIENGKGILFVVMEKTDDLDEGHIDNVKHLEANGKTYITGGPTDVTYTAEDPEFDTFAKMQAEVPEVLKTLKGTKTAEAAVTEDYKLSDYFPFEKDLHLSYKGLNSEFSEYSTYVDFVNEDSIQIRNDNPGVMSVIVYTLKNGELKKVFTGGEGSYKHNYLAARNRDEIILKEPLKAGTEWQLKGGEKRSIASLSAKVETPSGSYTAIEVRTENKDSVTTDYYAKGIGLVKTIYKAREGDFTVSSELEKIERNVPYVHDMRVYFSDYANEKIYYQNRKVEINTNQDIKFKFQKELKTPPEGSGIAPVISANTKILGIIAEDKSDTVTVDFSEQLVSEMNAGAGAEMAIMKCLANTFGKYYQRDKVIITINGKPYESGHEIMEPGEYLTVDNTKCTEYKK